MISFALMLIAQAVAPADPPFQERPLEQVSMPEFGLFCSSDFGAAPTFVTFITISAGRGTATLGEVTGGWPAAPVSLSVTNVGLQRAEAGDNIRIQAQGGADGRQYDYELIVRVRPAITDPAKAEHTIVVQENGTGISGRCIPTPS